MVHKNSERSHLRNVSRLWRHIVWPWMLFILSHGLAFYPCKLKKEFSLSFSIWSDSRMLIRTNKILMRIMYKYFNLLGIFFLSNQTTMGSHISRSLLYTYQKRSRLSDLNIQCIRLWSPTESISIVCVYLSRGSNLQVSLTKYSFPGHCMNGNSWQLLKSLIFLRLWTCQPKPQNCSHF